MRKTNGNIRKRSGGCWEASYYVDHERKYLFGKTYNDLRHTYATLALQHGIDIKTVSATLRHSTVAFTLDKYGHVSDQMRHTAA